MMKAIPRQAHLRNLTRLLRENPVVALLGARQVGKTTLARELMRERRGPTTWFDLEHPPDLRQLDEPTLTLEPLRGLVVLDEIQNRPQLFPVLRVLADRSPRPARFLVLGSASPELLRQLPPWTENIGKRVVKSPKVYVADSGLLHTLLGIEKPGDLGAHPKVGASFEGFALEQVVRRFGLRPREAWFWATHSGAELDLLVTRGRRRLGFEFKRTDAPKLTRSMLAALDTLGLERIDVVHAGTHGYRMHEKVRAVPMGELLETLKPLA